MTALSTRSTAYHGDARPIHREENAAAGESVDSRRARTVVVQRIHQIVQHLLAARRDLSLPKALRQLDAFDLVILDDIGYVQQSADEAEVLFTLMAERYERRSLLITSNLVFSEWGRILKSPMTTAAAIDRPVHHATILEIERESIRAEDAQRRGGKRRRDEKEGDEG